MSKYAPLARLEAKPGKVAGVARFLAGAQPPRIDKVDILPG